MLATRIRNTAVALVAVAALTTPGVASAAAPVHHAHKHPIHARSVSRAVSRGAGQIRVPVVSGGTFAAISAFPTGDKGSGSEATCGLWSGQLNEDQGAVEAAVENNDLGQYLETKSTLDEHKDDALDAGCVVID